MDDLDPTLVGTGLLIVAAVVWVVCAIYAYQNAPRLGRSAGLWAVLAVIFGPIALMILYVLPKKPPLARAGSSDKVDPHEALYQVPKKKR
jgi:hypothetical protein